MISKLLRSKSGTRGAVTRTESLRHYADDRVFRTIGDVAMRQSLSGNDPATRRTVMALPHRFVFLVGKFGQAVGSPNEGNCGPAWDSTSRVTISGKTEASRGECRSPSTLLLSFPIGLIAEARHTREHRRCVFKHCINDRVRRMPEAERTAFTRLKMRLAHAQCQA